MLKSLMRKLFNRGGEKGKRKASPFPLELGSIEFDLDGTSREEIKKNIENNALSIAKGNVKVADALKEISSAISTEGNSKPIQPDRIQIDSAKVLVQLMSSGYEPLQVLYLLAKVYGSIMSSAPNEIFEFDSGRKVTPDMLEQDFFKACAQERQRYKQIHDAIFGDKAQQGDNDNNVVEFKPGTLH